MSHLKKLKIINKGQQAVADQLFTSIREVKGELKETSKSFSSYLEILEKIFLKSNKDLLQDKLDNYKRKLSSCKKELSSLTNYGIEEFQRDFFLVDGQYIITPDQQRFNLLKEKYELLEQLVNFVKVAIENGDSDFSIIINKLESKLRQLELRHVISVLTVLEENRIQLSGDLKDLRKILRVLPKSSYSNILLDLRQLYRRIIRFLFKNMNDESGDFDVLFLADRKQASLTNSKFKVHGIRRDYRATRIFA